VNEPERRKVSLAGLGLISAGAVLGLALTGPAAGRDESAPAPPAAAATGDQPEPPPSRS